MSKGYTCVISSCKRNSIAAKREGEDLLFFPFPRNETLFEQWVVICNCSNKIKAINKRVCSRHFKLEDFEDGFQSQLQNTTPKTLKKDAIPSLYLYANDDKHDNQPLPKTAVLAKAQPSLTSPNTICNLKKQFRTEKDLLTMKIADLENEEHINRMRMDAIDQKIELKHKEFENYVKFAFNRLPIPDQVQVFLSKKIKLQWTSGQFAARPFDVTLKYFSKPLYIYLRKTLHYPLPKLTELNNWIDSMHERKKIKKGKFSKFKKTFEYLKQQKKVT